MNRTVWIGIVSLCVIWVVGYCIFSFIEYENPKTYAQRAVDAEINKGEPEIIIGPGGRISFDEHLNLTYQRAWKASYIKGKRIIRNIFVVGFGFPIAALGFFATVHIIIGAIKGRE